MSKLVKVEHGGTLDDLAAKINAEHRACEAAGVSAVRHAICAGEMLTSVKNGLKHGEWLPWLEANFEGSRQIADVYRKLAANKHALNCQRVGNLSIRGALQELRTEELIRERESKRVQRRLAAARLLEVENWKHGDWKDYVPMLADESVSLLLTDPPYGMSYRSNRRMLPLASVENDDERSALANLADMLSTAYPKLAEEAHVVVFTSPRLEPVFREIIEACGFTLRSYPVWIKNNHGSGDLEHSFAPRHERLLHATKGNAKVVRRIDDTLFADKVRTTDDGHPTEKPVALLRQIIEALTVEGEAVLDPYGGVASTLVAAESCGRRGIGCEIDADYHAFGLIRLSKMGEITKDSEVA